MILAYAVTIHKDLVICLFGDKQYLVTSTVAERSQQIKLSLG